MDAVTLADLRTELADTRFDDLRWVAETGSTNDDLVAAAREGAPEGVVLVADHQRSGRGRLDRSWVAPPGSSLLASVLLRPALDPGLVGLVTLGMGVAAAEALRDVGAADVALKWPNDVVCSDDRAPGGVRKLGGILAEAEVEAGRVVAVVVGIGVNVAWPADRPPDLVASMASLGDLVTPAPTVGRVLVALLRRFDGHYRRLLETDGPAALVERYRAVSATLGRSVRVERTGDVLEGLASDLTAEGHLVVTTDDGSVVEVAVGDVVHLRGGRS